MSGHTPGPWIVFSESENDGEAEVIIAGDRTICWTADTWTGGEAVITDEDRANARLIAAAPDLLDAIKGLMELYANGQVVIEGDEGNDPVVGAAWAAIDKAEGRGEE